MGVLIAAGAVFWLTTFFGPPSRVQSPAVEEIAPRARTADDFAQLACVHVRLAGQAVQADAPAATVRSELAAARTLAAEALLRDGRFSSLSGGIAALDDAVRMDDARAARVGLQVSLQECERLNG
ncbi:MAG TPA: hypothetical protein VMY88_12865 [Acidimicrobiales bacterium]|nr:hypothetical protein [Acidimicrobiales bacterium]